MPRNVKFGLTPTPAAYAPWGVIGAISDNTPEADLHLQAYTKIGGNQNPTNSCVWWANAGAIHNVLRREGIASFWCSVLGGYYVTRLRSASGDRDRIVDFGCRPPDAAMVLLELGLIPDAKWPFIASQVDKEPDYGALVSSLPDWIRLKRIIAPEGRYGAAIRHTIHNLDRPVLIGQEVNQPYVDWEPGDDPWSFTPPMEGRHMELVDSYNAKGPLTVSSWGDTFRRQLAWKQVESESVSELWYPEIDRDKAIKMFLGDKR